MNEQRIKKLLDKYLSGTATKAEIFVVESWLESFQQDQEDMAGFDLLENHNALAEQIIAKALNEPIAQFGVRPKRTLGLWKKIAAAAATVIIISSVVLYFIKDSLVQQEQPALSSAYDRYQTPIKEFKQLYLPDSTIVYLNANSTLEVQQDFTQQKERRVKLKGEAFFDVKKDSKHPFKIQVGELQVKVLGTSFNINANEAANEIKVAVKSGKVNVIKRNLVLASLIADQSLVFNKKNAAFDVQLDPENAKALWREGIVVLDKASFEEVNATMYNIYGIKIKSDDSEVLTERYNFTIRSSRTLEQTINQLCEIMKKKYRKEGNALVIF